MALNEAQITAWREEGAFVTQLPAQVYQTALDWLNDNFTQEQVDPAHLNFGTPDQRFEFPTGIPPLDDLVLSEFFVGAVQQLLGIEDIRLLQADLWPKVGVEKESHGVYDNTEQRIHMDYGNNTLLHPDWYSPEAVAAIVYYDDGNETGGGTAYVPREGVDDPVYQPPFIHMPGQAGRRFFNDRHAAESWFEEHEPATFKLRQQLYDREKTVEFEAGTVLFYRHDIWHRGTPVVPGKLRRVHNLAWRRADARGWSVWNQGWARRSYIGKVESLIGRSSPVQRHLLDIPMPGDPYWTLDKIRWVEARFEPFGFDASPYLAALK